MHPAIAHSLTQQEIKKQFAKEEAKFQELDVQKKGVPCWKDMFFPWEVNPSPAVTNQNPPWLGSCCFFFGGDEMLSSYVVGLFHKPSQIIATSHDLTPNGGLVREIPLFKDILGWRNIIIWPDKPWNKDSF